MKNILNQNTGFILTSISYSDQKRNDHYQRSLQFAESTKRVITKYDYCLPPEEKDLLTAKK